MKKTLVKGMALAFVGPFLVAGSAMALPYGGSSASLQNILDEITVDPVTKTDPTDVVPSSVNVNTDYLNDNYDSYWNITASGGSVATMIIEIAGLANSNTFGVYNDGKYVQLFDGAATAGSQAMLSIKADGSVFVNLADTGIDFSSYTFGYYLNAGSIWHSDSALNADQSDHMLAYQGTNTDYLALPSLAPGLWSNNEYILAWEDLGRATADWDYDDMVLMVESVNPVPEPATMLLMGTGLAGLAGAARRRSKKA